MAYPTTSSETVAFTAGEREIGGYLALPQAADVRHPGPGVVVVHEIWGLTDHIRDVADRFAVEGYVALAPDLYSGALNAILSPERISLGMAILRDVPPEVRRDPSRFEELARGRPEDERTLLQAVLQITSPPVREGFAKDLVAVVSRLAERPEVDGRRVGAVGFCMGGGLVARLATLCEELRAGVIFYGQNPPLEDVGRIRAILYGIYGGLDPGITGTVPDFARAMGEAGKPFDYQIYPEAKHAFFNDTGPNYHPGAASDAWHRTLDFFKATIGTPAA